MAAESTGLVFVRVVDGSNEILRLRIEDGAEQAVTATPDREERWPYWSTAAGRLVYQAVRGGRESILVLWAPEGGEQPVPVASAREERWTAWAPGRAQLVYAFRGGDPPAGLALFDVVSGSRQVLTGSDRLDLFYRPSWSPDGGRLVAQRRDAQGKGSQLWSIPLHAPPRALTDAPDFFHLKPFFTRDGEHIVFSRRPASGGPHDVASIPWSGGAPRLLVDDPDADDHSARPSPVRDEMAFVSDRDGTPRIFVAGLDGSGVRALSPPGRAAFAPRWSPDGERLVAILTDGSETADHESLLRPSIIVLDRSGRILAETPGSMPDWMPAWP